MDFSDESSQKTIHSTQRTKHLGKITVEKNNMFFVYSISSNGSTLSALMLETESILCTLNTNYNINEPPMNKNKVVFLCKSWNLQWIKQVKWFPFFYFVMLSKLTVFACALLCIKSSQTVEENEAKKRWKENRVISNSPWMFIIFIQKTFQLNAIR